jgi:hypothetical protein
VKLLLAAGADVGATVSRGTGEHIETAFKAAQSNREFKIADYLKSVGGAVKKKVSKFKPIEAGAHFEFDDFEEIIALGEAKDIAAALSRVVKGRAVKAAYGSTIKPGKLAYLVARPMGLAWCNILRIAPPPRRMEDAKKTDALCQALSKETGTAVIWAGYSDVAVAAAFKRFESGKVRSDSLESKGKKHKKSDDELDDAGESMKRLEALAEKEKFVVGLLGLEIYPAREVELGFESYPAEAFDGFVLVRD